MSVSRHGPGPTPVPSGTEPATLPVQIVRASEVKHGIPLNPAVIKDFGQVLMDDDKTFSASISFENEAPTTSDPGNGGSHADVGALPDTGGTTLAALGVVTLLISGALLFAGLLSAGLLRRR